MSTQRPALAPVLTACVAFAVSGFAGHAAAATLAAYDALSARTAARAPGSTVDKASTKRFAQFDVRGHRDERLDVPSFLWVGESSPARRVALRGGDAIGNARAQLKALAPLYQLDAAAVDALEAYDEQRLPSGAHLVRLRQYAEGIEVFRDGVTLLSGADGRLLAVSGYAMGTGRQAAARAGVDLQGRGFVRDELDAIATVLDEHGLDGAVLATSMQRTPQRGAYSQFAPALPAQVGDALALTAPLRTKPVWFRLREGLVPAWYVESRSRGPDGERAFAHVVSSKGGEVLFRHDLVSHQQFSYQVWAESDGDLRPLSGPQGNSFIPHPTGVPDGSQPPFVSTVINVLQNAPFSRNDPWLPSGATETTGNNIDAYADRFNPDGFSGGDERASVTAPGEFHRLFDVNQVPAVSSAQIQASVTSVFYTTNWLHDAFYDAGFDEQSGNAQTDNYGRGGIEGDVFLAEAQDVSGTNNANMLTPADGDSPRMQMFVWSGVSSSSLTINPGNLSPVVQNAAFGPTNFDVTADVVAVDDGSTVVLPGSTGPGTFSDGCQPPTNSVTGRIALVDRGACGFGVKVQVAQDAGAIGVLVANNVAVGPSSMGGTAPGVTIPSFGITQADGGVLRDLIAVPTTPSARLFRSLPPVARDGTLDNGIVSHEWGHYISNRLIGNAAGLSNLQGGGMGEGWGDFHALMTLVGEGMNWDGVFGRAGWARGGPAPNNSYYYGGRRYPYSTDMSKAPLTLRHIQDSAALPVGAPINPAVGNANSQVHNTGNNWANMLWECYAALLKDEPRLDFEEAQRRMRMYLVGGYKLTPNAPTILEARDAVLATMIANDRDDFELCAAAFAKRGAGFGAIAPLRDAEGNEGVTESFAASGGALELVEAELDDQPAFCDLDGVLDGGETGTVSVELRNAGLSDLADSTLSVSSPTAGVSFPSGTDADLTASVPFEELETGIAIAYAPASGIQTIQLDFAWSDPDIAVPGGSSVQFRVNTDEIEESSASDDAEAGEPAWTAQLEQTTDASFEWRREATTVTSNHFHGPDSGGPGISAWVSPPLQVSPTAPLVVTFNHRFQFEQDVANAYDGGVLEISDDGGTTWSDIGASVTPGYNGTLSAGSNPFTGRAAFVRQSAAWPAFESATLDLGTTFAGESVRLRFAIGTDANTGAPGWDVDDIVVGGILNTPFPILVGHRSLCASADIDTGDAQSTLVNTPFANPLTVTLLDAEGDPITGVEVRFVAPSLSGASAMFPGGNIVFTTVTNGSGVASAPAPTANEVAGSYAVAVQFGAMSAPISLTNTAASNTVFANGFEN